VTGRAHAVAEVNRVMNTLRVSLYGKAYSGRR
jgi:hypothetical protein